MTSSLATTRLPKRAGVTSVSPLWILTNTPFFIIFWYAIAWIVVLSVFTPSFFALYEPTFTLQNFITVFTEPIYYRTLWDTLWMAMLGSFIAVAISYPLAFHISRRAGRFKSLYIGIVVTILMVSFIVKLYAWQIILAEDSPISTVIAAFGAPDSLLGTKAGVILGLVYASMPYTILSLVSSIDQVPASVEEAAAVYGASPFTVFRTAVLPMTLPGVATALIFAIPLNFSAFLAPMLLGRGKVQMTALQIYSSAAGGGSAGGNWPMAAALSVTLLVISLLFTFGVLKVLEGRFVKR